MSQSSVDILEALLKENGLGWMIGLYFPQDQALPAYVARLELAAEEYRSRCGEPTPFSPEILQAEAERNPHKVQAFLQFLRPNRSPAMLVMVWRVLQGFSMRDVTLTYRERDSFSLEFTLASPAWDGPEQLETYVSDDIQDAALFKHLGVTKVNGKPLFEGFYARRLYDQNAP